MKTLICGDMHGDFGYARRIVDYAKRNSCEVIIVCGDFGLWEHEYEGLKFTTKLSKKLLTEGVKLLFVDGNHENHDLLDLYHRDKISKNNGIDGIVEIKANIFHIPRGHIFEIGNTTLMGFGGAFSIDRSRRKIGKSLWLQEEITEEDLAFAVYCFEATGKAIDIVISHEGPCVPCGLYFGKDDLNSVQQRGFIQRLIHAVKPKKLFFGHYHVFSKFEYGECECQCLPGGEYVNRDLDFVIVDT